MRAKPLAPKAPTERIVNDIRRATRKHYSAEDKIRIVLDGLRGEDSIAAWLSHADRDGSLAGILKPDLTPPERTVAQVEGWILGVPGLILEPSWGRVERESHARN